MCHHHNLSTHVGLGFFLRRTLNNFNKLSFIIMTSNKNKQISHIRNIVSKRQRVFIESFTIFFSKAGETENVSELEYKRFQEIVFGRLYTCNIYIATLKVSEFTQLYTCYKFYPLKELSDLQEFHIWHRLLTIQGKHSYFTKSVCVFYFTES